MANKPHSGGFARENRRVAIEEKEKGAHAHLVQAASVDSAFEKTWASRFPAQGGKTYPAGLADVSHSRLV